MSVVIVGVRLYRDLLLDVWPSPAACVDYGIDSRKHYGALQWAVKHDLVTQEQLVDACGDGRVLTELTQVEGNPYQVAFRTSWDILGEGEEL